MHRLAEVSAIGTARAVEVLYDRGTAMRGHFGRWTGGSGYLIGGRLVLTAAHNVGYRQHLGLDEQLLVRTIGGDEWAAGLVLVCDEPSGVDLALLEISEPAFDEDLPPVTFARINQDSPAPVNGCWAVGFPRFAEAEPVLPGGSRRDTWHVRGDILPGGKQRGGRLALQVSTVPQPIPADAASSAWMGMSGAVVFVTDSGSERALGVVSTHHHAEGNSTLTVVPIAGVAGLANEEEWWRRLRVADPAALPVKPPVLEADEQRSRLAGGRALREHWDPRGRGVEHHVRPGWFFTGRYRALSELVTWLNSEPQSADNMRVVTGGPGSGKSAVLARLVTMSDLRYRARMPAPLADDDPVARLAPGAVDIAIHARAAAVGSILGALAAAVGATEPDLEGIIGTLVKRRRRFTVVVDALDEAEDPPALAMELRRLASGAADAGVRLLVGTRPGGPTQRLITDLGLSAVVGDPALIDLDLPGYLSQEDLAEYVRRRLLLIDIPPGPESPDTPYRGHESLASQVAVAVAANAYPTFLIGQLASRALLLRSEPVGPGDLGWQQFPRTVAEAMDQYLAGVGSQSEQDRVEDVLRPLAYARGDGLPLEDAGLWLRLSTALARTGRRYSVRDLAAVLDTAADYLVETVVVGQATYCRLYHQALTDRLRERDWQPRRDSAAQIVYQCLLDSVPQRPGGARNWLAASPYLRIQLAGHAADTGQLTNLLEDPEFLVAADPAGLFTALQRSAQAPGGNAQVYRYAYPHLAPDAEKANERASYLQLAARRQRHPLADQLSQLPLQQSWTSRWVSEPRTYPHYIAGRHDGSVEALALGGRRGRPVIISGSLDSTVRVWDLETGELALGPLTGHDGGVQALAIGMRAGRPVIVSGSLDRTLRVWDLETGELALGPLTGHNARVYTVAVGERQGRPVIISGGRDGAVRVWDLETGELTLGPLTGHDGGVQALAIGMRAGRPVIVSGSLDRTLRVWDLETGELALGPLTGHNARVYTVAVGERQGRPVIISGGGDRTVRVWDLETGELALGPLTGHNDWVYTVAVGERQGRPVIISGGYDKAVRVWDLETGNRLLAPLTGHGDEVEAVAVGERQGRPVIISGGSDRTVRVWDLEPDEPTLVADSQTPVSTLAVGERQARPVIISGGSDGTVRVRDLETGDLVLGPLTGHKGRVYSLAASQRQGRPVIISGGSDGTVRVRDLETGGLVLGPLTGHSGEVKAVASGVRHGRPVIISGSFDRTVRVWDLESGELALGPLTTHSIAVSALAVGMRLGRPVIVSGGFGGTVRVWDLESGELVLGPLTGHNGGVQALAVGIRQGRAVIISGSGDEHGTVRVWDLESGELVLGPLTGHSGGVQALAVGIRQGRPVAVASGISDRTVRVWELESEFHAATRIELDNNPLAIASIGSRFAIGTTAGLLRVDLL